MEYDFGRLSADERYKLLVSFVGPRPIALVTSLSPEGINNAAPMSFFNVFAQTPPLLILGLQNRPSGAHKDTTRDILETEEFVVNLPRRRADRPADGRPRDRVPARGRRGQDGRPDLARERGRPAGPDRRGARGLRVPARARDRVPQPLDHLRRGRLHARPRRVHRPGDHARSP